MRLTVAKGTRCIYRVLLILLIFSLFVTGCEQTKEPEKIKEPQPLWAVNAEGDPAPPIWMAVSASQDRLEYGEDIDLVLHFRTQDYDSGKYKPSSVVGEVWIKLSEVGSNVVDERIDVKKYDNYSLDLYQDFTHNGSTGKAVVEEITISANELIYEEGAIAIFVDMFISFSEGPIPLDKETSGIAVYYVKYKDYIQLFPSYYYYFNREK